MNLKTGSPALGMNVSKPGCHLSSHPAVGHSRVQPYLHRSPYLEMLVPIVSAGQTLHRSTDLHNQDLEQGSYPHLRNIYFSFSSPNNLTKQPILSSFRQHLFSSAENCRCEKNVSLFVFESGPYPARKCGPT